MPDAFDLQILPGSPAPIFRQIMDQVSLAVARGTLTEGDPLPSVRGLAERLVVNPNTVAKAYAELVRGGILETRQGKGVFVARQRQVYTHSERLRRLAPALDAFVNQAISLNMPPGEIRDALNRKLDELHLNDNHRSST